MASNAFAAECVVQYKRTACLGQEAESYSKCDGKQECDKVEEAATEEACAAAAEKACENARLTITMSKVVTAKFQGKALKGGQNFCAANRADFNKCKAP